METMHDRLRKARQAAGYDSAADAASAFGWNYNTYSANENGNATFSYKKAKVYAAALKVRPEWLYDADGAAPAPAKPTPLLKPPAPGDPVNLADLRAFLATRQEPAAKPGGRGKVMERRIPVVGEVAAGLWRESVTRVADDVEEWLPVEVQGYERAQLKAFKVVGPSMNLVYPEGRFVIAAHPAEAGLRPGDYVVVERAKADLVEITLKEFTVEEDGRIALWPRSSSAEFQEPIYFKATDEQDQSGLTIIGVIIGDFGKRERPPLAYAR